MNDKLTTTRLSSLRRCPRQHYYRFELGLSRIQDATALRFGSAFHLGLACGTIGEALDVIDKSYAACPPYMEQYDWDIEHTKVTQLLIGWFWRYDNDDFEILAVEQGFEIPLINPETGAPSRTFHLGGKIDKIVSVDNRPHVLEHKTTSEDIGTDSDYWLRLRCDPQLSQYVLGARGLGYDTNKIIYDVTRKPTIQPKQIPLLDEDGLKIVLDESGDRIFKKSGNPRLTGDAKQGFVLQTRKETHKEYGERLLTDIGDRPDFYYARREVPRLEDELQEFQTELWQQAKQLREAQRYGRWFRNVGKMTCDWCQFTNLCLQSIDVDRNNPPVGFEILDNVFPELTTN